MTGYKIIVTEYSGAVTGDEVIYTNKAAAQYLFAEMEAASRSGPNPEQSPEVKLVPVTYVKHSEFEGLVGRTIHQLDRRTRKDCVRETAFSKLTQEEINAIQELR